MQRSTTIMLGALVMAAVGLLLIKGGPRPMPVPPLAWSATLAPSALSAPSIELVLPSAIAAASLDRPPPRKLPVNAPRSVRFGVVLVEYRGSQYAPEQAPYKPDALQRARQLAELARKDFKSAVKQGDPGSTEDAGRINRGILEPGAEVELFSLAPGAVSEPIDTPRGYWIARRIE